VSLRFDVRVAASGTAAFLFHPDHPAHENDDGTATVCFAAGGLDEMYYRLAPRRRLATL